MRTCSEGLQSTRMRRTSAIHFLRDAPILHRARVLPGTSIVCNVVHTTNEREASHVRRPKSRGTDGRVFLSKLAREMDDVKISRGCSLELVDVVFLDGTSGFLTLLAEVQATSQTTTW